MLKKNHCLFVFALTFPGVAYQPHSIMTVSVGSVADIDRCLGRVQDGKTFASSSPSLSFMHISVLLSDSRRNYT